MNSRQSESHSVSSLTIGLDPSIKQKLIHLYQNTNNLDLDYDLEKLMNIEHPPPGIVLCGNPPSKISVMEVGQLLRVQFPEAILYLILGPNAKCAKNAAIKNGFNDVFFLPLDLQLLSEEVESFLARAAHFGRVYRSIQIIDLKPGSTLEFDTYIYLPVNNKHVKVTSAGTPLDDEKFKRLSEKNYRSIFIDQEQLHKFYEYTVNTLKSIGSDQTLSETDRRQKLNISIRNLISGLFNDDSIGTDQGRQVVEQCHHIVRSYFMVGKDENWYDRVLSLAGSLNHSYTDLANVSTLATLYAIGLGLKNVEDIAMAALLRDLGLYRLPSEIVEKDPSLYSAEERILYEKHPEESVKLIQERKLTVSEKVHQIIIQHHEHFCGDGFPRKLIGQRICIEAQLLNFVEQFNDLISIKPGYPTLHPIQAIRFLRDSIRSNPGKATIDPKFFNQIYDLFPSNVEFTQPQTLIKAS